MRARTLAMAATGVGLTLVVAGCGSGSGSRAEHGGATPVGSAASATLAGQAADVAFAQLMIPHHRQAVEMAELALRHASSAQVKELATQIKSAQDPEITQMTQWLQEWGAPTAIPGSDASGMPGMDHSGMDMGGVDAAGMMTAEEMAGLAKARGAEFDRMWSQMMIAHHQGAIAMAQQVLDTTSDPKVAALARAVVTGQTAEIDTMRKLLAQ